MFKHGYLLSFFFVMALVLLMVTPVFAQTVTLTADPEGQSEVGVEVTFTASAEGIENPVYQFGYKLSDKTSFTVMPEKAENYFSINPPIGTENTYEIGVRVRETDDAEWIDHDILEHTVTSVEWTIELSADPENMVAAGETVTFSVDSNIPNPTYRFYYSLDEVNWTLLPLNDGSDTNEQTPPQAYGPLHIGVMETQTGVYDTIEYQIVDEVPADLTANQEVAVQMNELFYGNQTVNDFYSERTGQMSGAGFNASVAVLSQSYENIPQEFVNPLPEDGRVAAPAGACPAAAEPAVSYVTAADDVVTPELLEGKAVIPAAMIMGGPEDPDSLANQIEQLIDSIDQQQMANPETWNAQFWDELTNLQKQAKSLMDYHLWVVAEDIEEEVIKLVEQKLEAAPIPDELKDTVLNALANSNQNGWLANSAAGEGDAFARMEIVAEMTGNISGTVFEEREFSIPGAGQDPVFDNQTGEGTVEFNHPKLGKLTFEVDIELNEFDEQGRAIAGTVNTVEHEHGYSCEFNFDSAGKRKGDLYLNGELVGELKMTVDHDKFENYVDLDTGETIDLPDPAEDF